MGAFLLGADAMVREPSPPETADGRSSFVRSLLASAQNAAKPVAAQRQVGRRRERQAELHQRRWFARIGLLAGVPAPADGGVEYRLIDRRVALVDAGRSGVARVEAQFRFEVLQIGEQMDEAAFGVAAWHAALDPAPDEVGVAQAIRVLEERAEGVRGVRLLADLRLPRTACVGADHRRADVRDVLQSRQQVVDQRIGDDGVDAQGGALGRSQRAGPVRRRVPLRRSAEATARVANWLQPAPQNARKR